MEHIGKYQIQEELGRGGFGIVYRGWDPVVRRSVAIKVLNTKNDPGMLARFRIEAPVTGNLNHQNIVTVYDSGEHFGQPYFVMELLAGRTLRDPMRTGPPPQLWEKVHILLQVAEGLKYAHDNGVVHRDLKPSNVMVLDGARVKILDFGSHE